MPLATAPHRLRDLEPAERINVALGLALAIYTFVRAGRLSFTHDESLTFLLALKAPYLEIARSNVGIPSNNHPLNSLLAKLCSELATRPFALRLPNLLAHLGYLGAALPLARRAGSGAWRVLAFVLLTLHPFLLDFFSLCRGYGLACGLELLALWQLVEIIEGRESRPLRTAGATLLAGLTAVANLSFLVFFLGFAGVLGLVEIANFRAARRASMANARERLAVSLGLCGLVSGLICAWVVPIGLELRELGELYYGGERGFLEDTLGSLLEASTYYLPYPSGLAWALKALGVVLLGAALAGAVRLARQERPLALWLCALPLLTMLICVVQHHALGTKFPVDRTALFFIPMGALALATAARGAPAPRLGLAVLSTAALLLALNAGRALNLRYFAQWQYDAGTSRMLRALAEQPVRQRSVRLGANWLLQPAINYYREQYGFDWLQQRELDWLQQRASNGLQIERGSLSDDAADYYYYLAEDAAQMAQRKLEPILYDPISQATLARRLP